MVNDKKTYSDKEIYDALKMIRDICKNSDGSSCVDCKLSYREGGISYCGVSNRPNVWRITELPGEWKPFEKEETHGYK